jgi:hypothetical protein
MLADQNPAETELAQVLDLHNAQAYLKRRLEHIAPDAVLTLSWERFYRLYSQVIRGLAESYHFAGEGVDDIEQDVWLEVVQSQCSPG